MAKDPTTRGVRPPDREQEDALIAFRAEAAPHIEAIQALARRALQDAPVDDEGRGARQIRVEIGAGPEESPVEVDRSVECWDQDYICGKGPTGYMHCTVHVCMIVGPVVVLPG